MLQQTSNRHKKFPLFKTALWMTAEKDWKTCWTAYLHSISDNHTRPPALQVTKRNQLQLYKNVSKPMCSLITQIHTEKIGLNAFLTEHRVLRYLAQCPCRWRRQTAKHIICFCPQYTEEHNELFHLTGTSNYSQIIIIPQGTKAAANWLQQRGLLH